MHTNPLRNALLVGLGLFVFACGGDDRDASRPSTSETPPDSTQRAVEQAIMSLNEMRESLAATIDTPTVDKSTFQRVCKPVGKRAKELSAEHGWTVQQLAEKYRNPNHQLDEEAHRLYEQFAETPNLEDTWIQTDREGQPGWRYVRRITVQSSCLSCHGPKDKRPDFVKNGYPDDRAYNFEVGDLRGLYTVFVPAESSDSLGTDTQDGAG